jgi:competence protein ComGC
MKNEDSIIKLLIKLVIILIIIIVLTIIFIYSSSKWNVQILNNNSVSNTTSKAAPSQLKWYDSFKGVNNTKGKQVEDKGADQPKSFLQYEIEKNNR